MTRLYNCLLILLSFLLGAVLVAAFSPVNFSFLAFIVPALLIPLWFHASAKEAALRAYFFGIGFFGVGISWVFISIHRFGDTNALIAGLITLGFVLLLASPHYVQMYLLQRYFPKNSVYKILALFPASWVIVEWLRDWLFTGFPWLYLASSQTAGVFKGLLPIVGSFGTAGVMLLTAGLIYLMVILKGLRRFYAVAAVLLILITSIALAKIDWTQPVGKPVNVSLLQGNIPQSLKWDPKNLDLSLLRYWQLTQKQPDQQIIVWPENSIPLPAPDASDYLTTVNSYAQKHHLAIALGIPVPIDDNFYNALITLGATHDAYYKRHLVPFGEYVPFENLLRGVIDFFDLPMSEFVEGRVDQPLIRLRGIPIAPFICYEIAYSALVRQELPKAQLLLIISDDAWFGDSFAPWQHLQIIQMQAISTGRDVLSATNNGITAFISFDGKIVKEAPRNVVAVLAGTVQPRQGETPWVKFGDLPIISLAFLLILISSFKKIFRERKVGK